MSARSRSSTPRSTARPRITSFRVDALAGKTSLHLSGKGGFADGVWNGTIGDLFIDDSANINLQLDTPVKRDGERQDVQARSAVPARQGGAAVRRGGAGTRPAGMRAPMPTICRSARSPPASRRNVEYQGTVNATASASATGGAPFVGEARVDLVDAAIRHKLASGRTDVITFGSGFVTLKAEPAQLNAELRLDAAQRGLISGRLRADRVSADIMNSPMRGQLQMATGELGFLTLYVPGDRSRQRPLRCQPELRRHARRAARQRRHQALRRRARSLPAQPRAARARAGSAHRLQQTRVQFHREGRRRHAGELGQDRMARQACPTAKSASTARTCASSTCPRRASMLRRISTSASPAARSSSRARSRFRWRAFSRPTSPTPCCHRRTKRLVGPTEARGRRIRSCVTSEITMTLGDKVTIDTYGLTGHITGSITERTLPGEPTRATGELQVKDGQYIALARKLDIERGQLIFSGGLLVDPAVDIRAIKVFPGRQGRRQRARHRCASRGSRSSPSRRFRSRRSSRCCWPAARCSQCRIRVAPARRARARKSPDRPRHCSPRSSATSSASRTSASNPTLNNETSLVLGKYLSPRLYVSYGRLAHRVHQHDQDALHHQRSLDDQDRGRPGIRSATSSSPSRNEHARITVLPRGSESLRAR